MFGKFGGAVKCPSGPSCIVNESALLPRRTSGAGHSGTASLGSLSQSQVAAELYLH